MFNSIIMTFQYFTPVLYCVVISLPLFLTRKHFSVFKTIHYVIISLSCVMMIDCFIYEDSLYYEGTSTTVYTVVLAVVSGVVTSVITRFKNVSTRRAIKFELLSVLIIVASLTLISFIVFYSSTIVPFAGSTSEQAQSIHNAFVMMTFVVVPVVLGVMLSPSVLWSILYIDAWNRRALELSDSARHHRAGATLRDSVERTALDIE